MKKISLFAASAVLVMFVSCGNKNENNTDSVELTEIQTEEVIETQMDSPELNADSAVVESVEATTPEKAPVKAAVKNDTKKGNTVKETAASVEKEVTKSVDQIQADAADKAAAKADEVKDKAKSKANSWKDRHSK